MTKLLVNYLITNIGYINYDVNIYTKKAPN